MAEVLKRHNIGDLVQREKENLEALKNKMP
jgi:hypothetical protein